jgi:aspartyl-tRNA synthetase
MKTPEQVAEIKEPWGVSLLFRRQGPLGKDRKNKTCLTGDVEDCIVRNKNIKPSAVPPFTIQDDTDGGDELRMKYRYLDLRRMLYVKTLNCVHLWLILSALP